MNLGVGRYVAVKLSSGGTVRGYIRDIAGDHLALLPDGMAAPADIAYADVGQLRPMPQPVLRPRLPKIAKVVAVVVVAGFIVARAAACGLTGC